MTLPKLNVLAAPAGTKGFDCNTPLNRRTVEVFRKAGMQFALRYVPRVTAKTIDLTASEAVAILAGGLGIMPVQHVELPDWIPSAQKGSDYGAHAAHHCLECGISVGTNVWLDLEGVKYLAGKPAVPASLIINYCNNWYTQVAKAGFTPGIYVGYNPGLNASELYYKLRFEHYWSAYNLDSEQYPAVRGVQMKQSRQRTMPGTDVDYDPDITSLDLKGGAPLVLAPEGWLE
jgi:hypothetical protein